MKRLLTILLILFSLSSFAQTRIQAENYNSMQGVQLVEGGTAVGFIEQNDWMQYNITAPSAGAYTFRFSTGSVASNERFSVSVNGTVQASADIPLTGSYTTYTQTNLVLDLVSGSNVIRVTSVNNGGGWNFDWFEYEAGIFPTANAGKDTTITVLSAGAQATALLKGSATDDGSIVSQTWTKISGTGGTIANASQLNTSASGLTRGSYVFRLTVTDNEGKTHFDEKTVTVRECVADSRKMLLTPGGDSSLIIQGYAPGGFYMQINPGDTVLLRASSHWKSLFMGGFNGVSGCPIVVQSSSEDTATKMIAGIELQSCTYMKVNGRRKTDTVFYQTANPSDNFGIRIETGGGVGVNIYNKSKNIEVDRIWFYKKGYAVWAKTEINCDTSLNYNGPWSWHLDSINIHHCAGRNFDQDVVYAGSTGQLSSDRCVTCAPDTVCRGRLPMAVSNFTMDYCSWDSANRTGIQVSGARRGVNRVRWNKVTNMGYELNPQQGTGISLGRNTRNTYVMYNDIRKTFLYGIYEHGTDTNYVIGNRIDSTGSMDGGVTNSAQPPANILITTKETEPVNPFKTVIVQHNILGRNVTPEDPNGVIAFANFSTVPQHWSTNSRVFNNTRLYGGGAVPINRYTYNSQQWPQYSVTEYIFNAPSVSAGSNQTITLPISQVTLTASATAGAGSITTYLWERVSGPNVPTFSSTVEQQITVSNLIAGVYQFRITVTQTDGQTASATVNATVESVLDYFTRERKVYFRKE